jgi:hypothetical protein
MPLRLLIDMGMGRKFATTARSVGKINVRSSTRMTRKRTMNKSINGARPIKIVLEKS